MNIRDRFSLAGKVALVTAGGSGIGKAIVQAFAELGAAVVVADIDPAKCAALEGELGAIGADALVSATDVRDGAAVSALMQAVQARWGRIDVLVNNAGHHLGVFKKLEELSDAELEDQYQINLRHMFVVTRAAIPLMRRAGGGGSIINVSSVEGFRGSPYNVGYTSFKHAVTGFTKAMALELSPDNIRVNLIAPETTDSEQVPLAYMLKPETRDELLGQDAWLTSTLPSNRFGRPSDHAGAAVFLATDLSSWVNGATLPVDGGALASAGHTRTPEGHWTVVPEVSGAGVVV